MNEHTLSAGEMVAAFAKQNQLATIMGTTTGGQVLGGANFSVGHGFTLRFPAAGWYLVGRPNRGGSGGVAGRRSAVVRARSFEMAGTISSRQRLKQSRGM